MSRAGFGGWISNTRSFWDSLKHLEGKESRSFLWAVGHRRRVDEGGNHFH